MFFEGQVKTGIVAIFVCFDDIHTYSDSTLLDILLYKLIFARTPGSRCVLGGLPSL